MSDKKQKLPCRALLVYPFVNTAPGERVPHWDQIRIRAVTVRKVNGANALVSWREGSHEKTEVVAVANLASTAEKALPLLNLSALLETRPESAA